MGKPIRLKGIEGKAGRVHHLPLSSGDPQREEPAMPHADVAKYAALIRNLAEETKELKKRNAWDRIITRVIAEPGLRAVVEVAMAAHRLRTEMRIERQKKNPPDNSYGL